ncbi:MAG: hypothetical protein ACLFM1_11450, partial [Bacteroidales bacterium]
MNFLNSTIHFGPKARIIVERNAFLTIKNTTLTNLGSECDYMWQGIETAFGAKLDILASNIEHAHNGVYAGAKLTDCLCTGSNVYNPLTANADIFVKQSNFINCGTAIRDNMTYSASPQMTIEDSYFKSSHLLDPGYSLAHPDPYNPANNTGTRNPWAYKANQLQRTARGIVSKNRYLIYSSNNTFMNLDYGMELFQTDLKDIDSEYEDAIYGIFSKPILSSALSTNKVGHSTFNLHPGPLLNCRGAAIFARGSFGDKIENNTFGDDDPGTQQADNDNGIVMYYASGYTIMDNEFAKIKTAIRASNSGEGGGYIGIKNQSPWEYGNFFKLCNRSIYTIGDNSALKIRCNRCDNPTPALYDVNFLNGGELALQGVLPMWWPWFTNTNATQRPAGNQFMQNTQDYTYHEIESSSGPYAYIHHNEFIGDEPWRIMPKAVMDPATSNPSVALFELSIAHFQNGESCKPVYENNPYFLSQVNQSMNLALQRKDSVSAILDNGNTIYLLNAISNHHSGDNLSNTLEMNSPLSDTVLLSFMLHDSVTNQEFFDVLGCNTPVSKTIEKDFYERATLLQNSDKEKLWQMQVYNETCQTETSFQREYEVLNVLSKQVFSNLIRDFVDTSDTLGLVNFLQNENNNLSKELLFGIHLKNRDTASVQTLLSNYQPETLQDSMWKEYAGIFANNLANGQEIYYLSRTDKLFVSMLADHC